MISLLLFAVAVILIFASAVGFGAPFLPTLRKSVDDALDLLDLQKGQTMLELGSGDGRLLRAAAKKGIHSVGYEINPLLFAYSYIASFRYRKFITLRFANYWRSDLPKSDGVYVFLLQPYMEKLHHLMQRYCKQHKMSAIHLVSFSFFIESLEPLKKKNGMLLYKITPQNK